MPAGRRTARVGTAAFALGLFLAGPHAAGVAAADGEGDSSPAPAGAAGAGAASTEASISRRANRSTAAPAPSAVGSPRASGEAAARAPAVAGATSRAAGSAPARRFGAWSEDSPPIAQPSAAARSVLAVEVSAPTPTTSSAPVGVTFVGPTARSMPTVSVAPVPAAAVGVTPPRRVIWTPALFEPPGVIAAQAELNTAVSRFFNQASNWLAGLPVNDVTAWIDGALLMIRRSFFNQAPNVSPVQELVTAGLIVGSLGTIDPEGDPSIATVVGKPMHGTVELTAEGDFFYIPEAGYVGTDRFTVNIAPTTRGFNLLDPFGDGSRQVTVEVGSQGNDHSFESDTESEPQDPIDAAVYLPDASARITVVKGPLGQFAATVSLNGITPDTDVTWMDAKGRFGQVSVADLASEYWDKFATAAINGGGGVTVAVDFQDADGSASTVLLTNVDASQNASGQYEFRGTLAPNPEAGARIDQWDVIGASFKPSYENFRKTYIEIDDFRAVELDVTGADFFATTYTPSSYVDALHGTDAGIRFADATRMPEISRSAVAATASVVTGSSTATTTLPVGRAFLSGWPAAAVTVMMPYSGPEGDALIIGDGSGRVKFGGLVPGWNTLKGAGWAAAVNTVMPYQDGFVVGLDSGAVEQWTNGGWRELQGTGWAHPVASMIAYQSGFVVGLGNGSIQRWDGGAWTELKDDGWRGAANTLMPYQDGFVVGLGTGAVQQWTNGGWRELKDSGWAHPVTAMIAYQSGFVVGLGNGSIQQWDGTRFKELKDAGWAAAATTLVPTKDGFVVGLASGAVFRWDGQGWAEVDPSRISLTEDTLRAAVTYAQSGGEALGASDPLFGQLQLKPACAETNSCAGSFYPMKSAGAPKPLASKTFNLGTAGGQSLTLSYDVGVVTYGYLYVPDGVFDKLKPSEYAAGAFLGLPTGPSLTLDLAGGNGTFSWTKENLATLSYSFPPSVYGSFEITGKVDAGLDVTLGLPADFTGDSLSAHAYYVPGLLVTLNTGGNYGVETGVNAYPDIDVADFTGLTGITITPTLTPSVNASWGLFTPSDTPIIGKFSIFNVDLGYKNPVSLELALSKTDSASLTLTSSGFLTYGAAVLPTVTEAFSFADEYKIYEAMTGNLLL